VTVDLPPVLAAYVAAKNAHDVEGQLACFAPDATVHDEGEELHGTDELRPWIQRTTDAYDLTVDPTAVTESPDETVMTALVSGSFPGSPLEFRYFLTITSAGIASFRTET
jgi:ketosteroid isomerase-like protein